MEIGNNNEAMEEALNFAQERRETTLIRLAHYQQSLTNHRQRQIKPREFEVGDLVLRKTWE